MMQHIVLIEISLIMETGRRLGGKPCYNSWPKTTYLQWIYCFPHLLFFLYYFSASVSTRHNGKGISDGAGTKSQTPAWYFSHLALQITVQHDSKNKSESHNCPTCTVRGTRWEELGKESKKKKNLHGDIINASVCHCAPVTLNVCDIYCLNLMNSLWDQSD